jgi:hypothetical protein
MSGEVVDKEGSTAFFVELKWKSFWRKVFYVKDSYRDQ